MNQKAHPTIKGIIFDVDGVLIDSENIHFAAYQEILKQYNFNLDRDGYKKWFSGKSIDGGIKSLLVDNDISVDAERIKDQKITLTKKLFQAELVLNKDTVNFIENVNARNLVIKDMVFVKPLVLALTTGLEKELVDEIFKVKPGLKSLFTAIISAEDYTHSKPNPESYIRTAQKMNLPTDSLIGVEDTPSGIAALNDAGIFSIAVTTTFRKNDLKGANLIVCKLTDLSI